MFYMTKAPWHVMHTFSFSDFIVGSALVCTEELGHNCLRDKVPRHLSIRWQCIKGLKRKVGVRPWEPLGPN